MKLKQIFITSSAFLLILLSSCATAKHLSSVATQFFSSEEPYCVGEEVVYHDEFENTKIYAHTDVGHSYTTKKDFTEVQLFFEPVFKFNRSDNTISYWLKFLVYYTNLPFGDIQKIILLTDTDRAKIPVYNSSTDIKAVLTSTTSYGNISSTSVSNFKNIEASVKISKDDFEKISKLYTATNKVRLGLYTTNGIMEFEENKGSPYFEITETPSRLLFNDSYDFYKTRLSDKTEDSVGTVKIEWEKVTK